MMYDVMFSPDVIDYMIRHMSYSISTIISESSLFRKLECHLIVDDVTITCYGNIMVTFL